MHVHIPNKLVKALFIHREKWSIWAGKFLECLAYQQRGMSWQSFFGGCVCYRRLLARLLITFYVYVVESKQANKFRVFGY